MALVLVVDRAGVTEEHELHGDLTIGRAAENDVVLRDTDASRRHVRVEVRGDDISVIDLGSANGTRLNGVLLEPRLRAALVDGDSFVVGAVTFELRNAAGEHRRVRPLPATTQAEDSEPRVTEPERAPQANYHLSITTRGETRTAPLVGAVVSLGRDARNDIAIDDATVSGRHATLIRSESGGYLIEDLGSTNGLHFEGERIPARQLEPGDVIQVSATVSLEYRSDRRTAAVVKTAPAPVAATQVVATGARRETVIGRDSTCDLPFDHPMLSRRHCRIGGSPGQGRYVEDLGSTNGTFVNGRRLTPRVAHPLRPGDELRCGPVPFTLDGYQIEADLSHEAVALVAVGLHQQVRTGLDLLQDVSFAVEPSEFVAVVGISGAGKSTLLGALSGFRPATAGAVLVNGHDLYHEFDAFRTTLGFVPQDDILHRELPVARALEYAAELRLPEDTTAAERRARVDEVLGILGLREQAHLPIASLSGGQRKRVSIGAELLTNPGLFFLDEATSGLDPSMEGQLMRFLRRLADDGHTVVLITHATKNVMLCDKVVFLARGGYLAFFGPPEEALTYFDVRDFDSIYEKLDEGTGAEWDARFRAFELSRDKPSEAPRSISPTPVTAPGRPAPRLHRPGGLRQFGVLSRRYLDIVRRDRATMLILLLSAPLAGLLNFFAWPSDVLLFAGGDASRALIMAFMLTLIPMMIGTISPVREIVKERAIYLRERTVCLRVAPYLASKLWVWGLLSLWGAAAITILTVVALDLPGLGLPDYGKLFVSLALTLFSGVLIGLLVSAVAPREEQSLLVVIAAVLVQIVFSGGVLPLGDMGGAGTAIGAVTSMNWGFRAVVSSFGLTADGCPGACHLPGFATFQSDEARQAAFQPVNDRYGDVLGSDIYVAWAAMAALIVVYCVALWAIQRRKDVV